MFINLREMKHFLTIQTLASIDEVAAQFLSELGDNKLVAFYAPMGAGKTTFTTAICRVLGVADDAVSSPTFSIVNEYKTRSGESLFHFDFYRIESTAEAMDIGLFDYLDSGSLCIMEWPENIEDILPEETVRVRISVREDGSRALEWED